MMTQQSQPGSRRWLGLALVAAAQFVVIIDTSIMGVALPDIRRELGFSAESLSWVFNAYMVAFGGVLLPMTVLIVIAMIAVVVAFTDVADDDVALTSVFSEAFVEAAVTAASSLR